MNRKEIWITVSGGLITEVKSTEADIKVNIIDYDNLEVSDEDREEIGKLEELSENEFIIF
jgi:hypothetical protein